MEASFRRRGTVAVIAAAAVMAAVFPSAAAAQGSGGPAHIAVTASLGSCDGTNAKRVCEIRVSFEAVSGAESYETTIHAPDGSALVDAAAEPGQSTYSVSYRGNGRYVVRVTAFGSGSN